MVNSKFTEANFRDAFPNVKQQAHVLYPPIDVKVIDRLLPSLSRWPTDLNTHTELKNLQSQRFFLSISYEPPKKLDRALLSYAMRPNRTKSKDEQDVYPLVIAGSLNCKDPECVATCNELRGLAESLGLVENRDVYFLFSISENLKWSLLFHSKALIYTPSNEHFGIGPLEAMVVGTPVIACASGGPKETILDGLTGYLCRDDGPEDKVVLEFAEKLHKVENLQSVDYTKMARNCREHVLRNFNTGKMGVVSHLLHQTASCSLSSK